MLQKVFSWAAANRKTILITFEIFWIVVFMLDRVINASTAGIPQFIYVNF